MYSWDSKTFWVFSTQTFMLLYFTDMLPSSIRGAMLCGLLLLALTATVTQANEDDDENGSGDEKEDLGVFSNKMTITTIFGHSNFKHKFDRKI